MLCLCHSSHFKPTAFKIAPSRAHELFISLRGATSRVTTSKTDKDIRLDQAHGPFTADRSLYTNWTHDGKKQSRFWKRYSISSLEYWNRLPLRYSTQKNSVQQKVNCTVRIKSQAELACVSSCLGKSHKNSTPTRSAIVINPFSQTHIFQEN